MSKDHINKSGNLHMIDVSDKEITTRVARASGTITLNDEALASVVKLNNKKGDVLNTARISGINAAKQKSNLIPLAHNVSLNSVEIDFEFDMDIETENKIKNYLINQSKLKKEKHSYSIEEFGLNEAKVKDCFKNYMMNYEF